MTIKELRSCLVFREPELGLSGGRLRGPTSEVDYGWRG